MNPFDVATEDIHNVDLLLLASKAFQEVAGILTTIGRDIILPNASPSESKTFPLDLKTRFFMLYEHLNLASEAISKTDSHFIDDGVCQLESIITLPTSYSNRLPIENLSNGRRLHRFTRLWNDPQNQDTKARRELAESWLDFGDTPKLRRKYIQSIHRFACDIRAKYIEDTSQLPEDDELVHIKVTEPPSAVWDASRSIFKALVHVTCRDCEKCKRPHDFNARLRLGTYRKPRLDLGMDLELDFDAFLSLDRNWQEAHIKAIQETKGSTVRFLIDDAKEQSQPAPNVSNRVPDESLVRRLCKQLDWISRKEMCRLELKVMGGKLFQLRSTKSSSLIDKTKDAISLEQCLRERPDAMSAKAKLMLGVLLGSAVLHLHATPWLQPDWGSHSVLFFRTTSFRLPLRPFIQAQLLDQDEVEKQSRPLNDSDSNSSDDFDLDDMMQHQIPALVSLAVVLMELYSARPFDYLAHKYDVAISRHPNESRGVRYMNICEVFERWKADNPENTQFPLAVDKCLDWRLWQDDNGAMLDGEILKTKIYEEIVRRLETELIQAFSNIPIDELDAKAAELDFENWDQMIPTETQRPEPNTSRGIEEHTPHSFQSPPTIQLHFHHQEAFRYGEKAASYALTLHAAHSPVTARSAPTGADYEAVRFFDDETTSDAHTKEAYIPQELNTPPIKVAILDTGIDITHQDVEAREEQLKGKYNWLDEKAKNRVHDRNGHGTFTACLVLDYAPDVELYVAKIADDEPTSPLIIAKAINHAVLTWKVDIISMSFGYPTNKKEGYTELEEALERAQTNKVLLFAAASNGGAKLRVSYPAREPTVIAVHATDTNGSPSGFNPTATADAMNLATVGESVMSAWPVMLCSKEEHPSCVQYKSGTSFATPIMAGIAAFLLQYARLHLPDRVDEMKKQKCMKAILRRLAEKGSGDQMRGGFHFVDLSLYEDSLFGKKKEFIDLTLSDILNNA